MKTTTQTALKNKLAKLHAAKKLTSPKGTIAYNLVESVTNGETFLRPCYVSGSGRYTSNQDHTDSTKKLLDLLGVEYKFGNNAARGSATGNYISISTKIK